MYLLVAKINLKETQKNSIHC